MTNYITIGLILIISTVSLAQGKKTRLAILDPFEVMLDPSMSNEIEIYVNQQKLRNDSLTTKVSFDSLTENQKNMLNNYLKYQSNFNIGSAFSQYLYMRLFSELELNEESEVDVFPVRQKCRGDHKDLKKIAVDNKADLIFNIVQLSFYLENGAERLGKIKFQIYNRETNKSFELEYVGYTSAIDGWTFYKCEEGEFKCIIIHLVDQILGQYLY